MTRQMKVQAPVRVTWEQICPKWAKQATKSFWRKLTDKQKHNFFRRLKSAKYCFIGEAHGYDSSYYYKDLNGNEQNCKVCNQLCGFSKGLCEPFAKKTKAQKMFGAADFTKRPDWKLFEKRKEEFVKHWNAFHVERV